MTQLCVVAQVIAMGVQHVLLQAQLFCQDCQVLVLNQSRPVSGQAAFFQVRENVIQVNGSDKLHNGITEKLKPETNKAIVLDI